jgi:Tfp pilus assembly protein PilV
MLTFPAMTRSVNGARAQADTWARRLHARGRQERAARPWLGRMLARLPEVGSSEAGVTLIEVVISAMLVGVIAIGTLSGFDSAGRATADVRAHNQATILAGADEERLRGLNASELGQMGTVTQPTVTENGTKFTIESEAHFVSASKESFTCETASGTADYIQTTSKVSWSALGKREAVKQSSLVAIKGSTALLVKVTNQSGEPVEGALVSVTGTSTSASQYTPTAGCVIFGAIADKKVKVTATRTGWVNANGESEPAAKEYTLSTTSLTTAEFKIAQAGKIEAEFVSNGSAVGVTSDTFYAYQASASGPYIGGKPEVRGATALLSGIFPFAPKNTYSVWAGDCAENNPEVDSGKTVTNPSAQVEPGGTTTVKVEVPALNITVYKGATSLGNEGVLAGSYSASITNTACKSKSALNEEPLVYKRSVSISSAGALEQKYQPYAKELALCVVGLIGGTYYKNTQTFSNIKKTGTTESFYLKKTGYSSSSSALTC